MNAPTEALHRVPGRGAVVRETLRAVGESVRLEIAAALLLLLGLMLVVVTSEPGGSSGGADYDVADMTWPVVLLGLFGALAVWKSEEPSRRSYLWSMPVDRFRHTMMKVAGGWAWLMGMVAVYLLWAISIPLITGGHIVINPDWEEVMLRGRPPGTVIRDMTLAGHAWLWLVPFVGASMGYFAGTAVALVTEYPLRVLAGAAFAFFVSVGLAESSGGTLEVIAEHVFLNAVLGPYGLFTHATGILFLFDQPDIPGQPVRDMPNFGAWLRSSALWTGTAFAAMLLAARRYQER